MNIFELASVASPVGGGVGAAMAAHHAVPENSVWILLSIPVGIALGIVCHRVLIRLAIGKHDRNLNIPDWRIIAVFCISFCSLFIAAALSYGLINLFFNVTKLNVGLSPWPS